MLCFLYAGTGFYSFSIFIKPLENAIAGWPSRAAFRSRTFWCLTASFFLAPMAAQLGVLQHQVPLIIDAGISPATATTALGLTAGVGGLGKLSFGRLTEIYQYALYLFIAAFLVAISGIFLAGKPMPGGRPNARCSKP